jgi:hypothetical protein
MQTLFRFPNHRVRTRRMFLCPSSLRLCLSGACPDYDYVVPLTQSYADGTVLGIQPGDMIGLQAGKRGRIQLSNMHGTASQPVKIVNKDGRLRISSRVDNDGITILGSSHFELRGDGVPGIARRSRFSTSTARGGHLSANYETCYLEIYNTGFAGLHGEDRPDPPNLGTQRPNFVQHNTRIHDDYLHDLPGESLYIGKSFYSGTSEGFLRHEMHPLRVYTNITRGTGR